MPRDCLCTAWAIMQRSQRDHCIIISFSLWFALCVGGSNVRERERERREWCQVRFLSYFTLNKWSEKHINLDQIFQKLKLLQSFLCIGHFLICFMQIGLASEFLGTVERPFNIFLLLVDEALSNKQCIHTINIQLNEGVCQTNKTQ